MAVRPTWQGRGVAEELLKAAESELRRAECGRVSLDTTRPLGRAIRFYEARGFRNSGGVSDFFGIELIEYIKTLGPTDMEPTRNDLGQPIGFPLPGWSPPHLQRSPAATEAMFLMMRWASESGYRRYEWKCDALNAASRAAAQRLGLSFEGVFRQAAVYTGRNRDTAWYAAIDAEWPALREAFLAWLDPSNFDGDGQQHTRLSDRTRPLLEQRGCRHDAQRGGPIVVQLLIL
jgi:RimJ/RimL family protein N-acetyltransferase